MPIIICLSQTFCVKGGHSYTLCQLYLVIACLPFVVHMHHQRLGTMLTCMYVVLCISRL